MLANLACAPGGWLAVIGRAASPSEKTARASIVPQVRDDDLGPPPMAARPRHLLDQAASRSGRSRALLHSSSNGSSELKSANLMGTNRELFAGAVSFDARDMASILSIKISASI